MMGDFRSLRMPQVPDGAQPQGRAAQAGISPPLGAADGETVRPRCPPALPFVFSVGITGHRREAIPEDVGPALAERLRGVLAKLADTATAIHREEGRYFSCADPRLIFVTPLADGADQIAAEAAWELGYELHVILPFALDDYRAEIGNAELRAEFDSLFERASCVLELPGEDEAKLEAYVMAGRATIAHSDVMVAAWDGLPPRGRGGTGEIVELALTRGTPTVHVPIDPSEAPTLRWSAYDPAVVTRASDAAIVRPFGDDDISTMLRALLAPPADLRERQFIERFQGECRKRFRLRIEYPLLLTAAGVARLRQTHWRADMGWDQTRAEWEQYREACRKAQTISAPLEQLQAWYEWPDGLASHFAQSYRSGHVFNFVLGAVAVLIALAGLVAPEAKKFLVISEFLVISAILANTQIGVASQWHRRWLDYRQLAERLRPMRALKLLAIASPDHPGSATSPIASRWVDWYAAAVWRAVACPTGRLGIHKVEQLARTIAQHEIEPQVAYHRSTARQVERLDHRLELLGSGLFVATLIACLAMLISVAVDPHWVLETIGWWTLTMAGLPAVGTAVFGIRVQGDYAGSSARSAQTAATLELIADHLQEGPVRLGRMADLCEQAARTMLLDLDEWRLLNQQHELSI